MTTRLKDERGSISVEAAIWLAPAVLALLGLVQLAVWWAASDTCSAAAQVGLDAGRVVGGTPADAQREATAYMTRVTALARDPQVSVAGTGTQMLVTVSADVWLIVPIPGVRWHIDQSAVGPHEHVTNPEDS
jgi:hypothetical protein